MVDAMKLVQPFARSCPCRHTSTAARSSAFSPTETDKQAISGPYKRRYLNGHEVSAI